MIRVVRFSPVHETEHPPNNNFWDPIRLNSCILCIHELKVKF